MALAGNDGRVQKALVSQDRQLILHTYAKEVLAKNDVLLGAALAVLGA